MRHLFLAGFAFVASLAFADLDSMRARLSDVTALKDKGVIGEQADGFLGVVKEEGNARSVVNAENADRKQEYEKRAKSQGQTLDVFAKVIGEARLRKEPAGRMIKSGSGWTKK